MINVELRIIYAFLREDENRSQNTHEYSKHSTITLRHPVLVCRSFHPVFSLSLSYLLLPRPYLSLSHASHMCIAIFLPLSFLHVPFHFSYHVFRTVYFYDQFTTRSSVIYHICNLSPYIDVNLRWHTCLWLHSYLATYFYYIFLL